MINKFITNYEEKDSIVGVLGGSFNPIHKGHMEIAKKAHEQFNIPELLIMPTADNYYKDNSDLIDGKIRLKMIELAIEDFKSTTSDRPYLYSSSLDIDRGGMTYTADTIADLIKNYNKIYFIIGSDSLMYLHTWKRIDFILSHATILYAKRDSDTPKEIENQIAFLEKNFKADIRPIIIDNQPFSSSLIRKLILEGKDCSKYISKSVLKYINENKLYQ